MYLGLDNSGKSTLVYRLLHPTTSVFPSIAPTVGFQIHTLPLADYNLQLWDVGGHSTLRPFWENYFDSTDILLWVVDAFATARLSQSHRELCTIFAERDRLGFQCSVVVLVNKVDLLNDQDKESQLLKNIRESLISDLGPVVNDHVSVIMCSALTGVGIELLTDALKERYI